MVRGNEIIVSANPRGVFMEGTLTAITPKPGTVLQIDASAGLDGNGRHTYELYNADLDGGRPKGPLFVLLPDTLRGVLATVAYASAAHCFLYIPVPGDELNMLVLNLAGTADDHPLGEMLIPQDATGKLIATVGSAEIEPFTLLEAITDPIVDTLAHCLFTGY